MRTIARKGPLGAVALAATESIAAGSAGPPVVRWPVLLLPVFLGVAPALLDGLR